jgi:hypothetical protein
MSATGCAGRHEACRICIHFDNDPAALEAAVPGWTALGSAYGSTRAEDGICGLHGIFVSAAQCCARFSARQGSCRG